MSKEKTHSDEEYIDILNNLINEMEGKLQKSIKTNNSSKETESIKMVLNYLREKKKELIDKPQSK